MNRLIISVSFLVLSQTVSSQIQFGVGVRAGAGEMKKIDNDDVLPHLNEIESVFKPTWALSVSATKEIHSLFNVGVELEYNNIIGVEHENFQSINLSDEAINKHKATTTRKAHYVSIPVYLNFRIAPKVFVGAGASVSYLITNSMHSEYRVNDMLVAETGGGNDLNHLDFGILTQANFQLSEKFVLNGRASWGVLNIRKENTRDAFSTYFSTQDSQTFKVKNRQFTLGLTYLF